MSDKKILKTVFRWAVRGLVTVLCFLGATWLVEMKLRHPNLSALETASLARYQIQVVWTKIGD